VRKVNFGPGQKRWGDENWGTREEGMSGMEGDGFVGMDEVCRGGSRVTKEARINQHKQSLKDEKTKLSFWAESNKEDFGKRLDSLGVRHAFGDGIRNKDPFTYNLHLRAF
jgi:hypothetical protein